MTRDAQGEFDRTPFTGPWIPARVMRRGSVSPEQRAATGGTEAHVTEGFELLIGSFDESGVATEPPTASSVYETDCPVLGNPVVELNGEPETLTNGVELFGWLAYGDVPLERS